MAPTNEEKDSSPVSSGGLVAAATETTPNAEAASTTPAVLGHTTAKAEMDESHATSSDTTGFEPTSTAPVLVVTTIEPHDILLGRGAPMIRNEGNCWFRREVSKRKKEYMSSGRHHVKNEIAKQVLAVIAQGNGRFLRQVESPEESERLGVSKGQRAWVLASNEAILEKVKQALRDKDSNNEPPSSSYGPELEAANPGAVPNHYGSMAPMLMQETYSHGAAAGMNGNPVLSSLLGGQQRALSAYDTLAVLRQQEEMRRLRLVLLRQQQFGLPSSAASHFQGGTHPMMQNSLLSRSSMFHGSASLPGSSAAAMSSALALQAALHPSPMRGSIMSSSSAAAYGGSGFGAGGSINGEFGTSSAAFQQQMNRAMALQAMTHQNQAQPQAQMSLSTTAAPTAAPAAAQTAVSVPVSSSDSDNGSSADETTLPSLSTSPTTTAPVKSTKREATDPACTKTTSKKSRA